ncbi:MAG TPA: UDP-N-acetylmuramoyl-L-alanyl-D-glutamate--2,6-diaminopimelate ligase [Azospirillaceae bacterium]|nr:UDP-N-acetylmuramoyl-L-alanyl-D-glutamate--2,6-diaminopimelate ligase [Azospirillaceae bacterium]
MATTMQTDARELPPGAGRVTITGLTADSRQVKPGFVFAAIPGTKADGTRFIAEAARAGAAAVIAPPGTDLPPDADGVVLIEDPNPRKRLATMAAAFYGRQPRHLAAVTGTNGKTSTAQFTRQIWQALGHPAGALGTLGLVAPGRERAGELTTADPVALHQDLFELAEAGVEHVALEASSHGIHQFRLEGLRLEAAAFTNLTHEHLDYHGSMEAYFDAKAALFDRVLLPGGTAVLNADTPQFEALNGICAKRGHRVIGFGANGAEIRVRDTRPLPHGQRVELTVFGRDVSLELGLVGKFQVWNALCALGLAIGCGADPQAAVATLPGLAGVRGRMEMVAVRRNGAAVYVDYAHKPNALEQVLSALRPHARNRLWVVFGCGGDRDRAKRPMMGGIAARLADRVIVTDDNPRTEDPAAIRAEVLAGARNGPAETVEIGDRAEAIAHAVRALEPGDLLVVAGKGHEPYQILGTEMRPFDDAAVARTAVAEADR